MMQAQLQFAHIVLRHSGEYGDYSVTAIAVHLEQKAAQRHADLANQAKDALLRKKLSQGYLPGDIHMADEMPLDPTLGVYYDHLRYSVMALPLVAGVLDADGLRAWIPPSARPKPRMTEAAPGMGALGLALSEALGAAKTAETPD